MEINLVSVTSSAVPCAPQNVKYSGDRESAVLSWNASVFSARYTVYNVSGTSRVQLCSTTELYCQLAPFDPGTTEVTASNVAGESIPTTDITGQCAASPGLAIGTLNRADQGLTSC